jgi:rhodanese-related sulfurtransferase
MTLTEKCRSAVLIQSDNIATCMPGAAQEVGMFGLFGRSSARNLSAEEVANGVAADEIIIVDVREPSETAIERIPGSVLLPLSTFDPANLPEPSGRTVVFFCSSGIRSVKACEIAKSVGLPYDAHLSGGLKAWKAAGYRTES